MLIASLLLVVTFAAVRAWQCPRCYERFAGTGVASMPNRCVTCGLSAFGPSAELSDTNFERRPDAQRLAPWLRRSLAGMQIASGVFVAAVALVAGVRLSFWFTTLVEGLAIFSILGGWLLWNDRREGYRLTRSLLLAQTLRVQGAFGLYVVRAGLSIDIVSLPGGARIWTFFGGQLLLNTAEYPFVISVNLFALIVLVLLAGARSGEDLPQPAPSPVAGESPELSGAIPAITEAPLRIPEGTS